MLPISSYRLQIRDGFRLQDAAEVTDYLADLGIDWLYVSPLLTAERGSDHGYDVTDYSSVDPSRGGPDGLSRLSHAAHELGMGVLVDIVPNHMGVATPQANAWWWDVLRYGRGSRYAEAFDIDWTFGRGKLRLPVLGDGEDELSRLRLVADPDGDALQLAYYDLRFPVSPGTAEDHPDARTVHSRQHYELMNWRLADTALNYRRFFAVNTLAGIRVEIPWVFEDSHREIVRWIESGLVDGLRVDHPDGLASPGGYLEDLLQATRGTPVWVEKILEDDERLPATWASEGTTGYDALADFDRVFVDPRGQSALEGIEERAAGRSGPIVWGDLIHDTKRAVADGILRSEVLRLARQLGHVADADDAIAELLACFPVYRSYLPLGCEHLAHAAEEAVRRRPQLADAVNTLVPMLADPLHPAAIRFQQTSGMVMAKGVEDTAYYRFNRLTSLNEVGANPDEFSIEPAEFHRRQSVRQAELPASMTTLSTHDTKRGEDVRARISVLSEIPDEWERVSRQLRVGDVLGDGPLELLVWQAIIGVWPASRERLHAYAEKAAREAGASTSWSEPNAEFEERMHALVDSAFDDPKVVAIVQRAVDLVQRPGWSNALSAKLIQLTAPGVPDVYQGSELWETSLVDPDNRRSVDFGVRRELLARIDSGWRPGIDASGAAKLLITTCALRLRRDHPGLFTRYVAITADGSAREHVLAFDRGGATTVATRLSVRLAALGGWGDTSIVVGEHHVLDVITGRRFSGGTVRIGDLLSEYPVALLVPNDGMTR